MRNIGYDSFQAECDHPQLIVSIGPIWSACIGLNR